MGGCGEHVGDMGSTVGGCGEHVEGRGEHRGGTWGARRRTGGAPWGDVGSAGSHALGSPLRHPRPARGSAVICDTKNPPQGPGPEPLPALPCSPRVPRPAGLCEQPDAVIPKIQLFLEKKARVFLLKVGIRKQRSATAVLPNRTFTFMLVC